MKFKGNVLITDPCYVVRDGKDGFKEGVTEGDWKNSSYGEEMGNLGIKKFITGSTGYGDGSFSVFKTSKDPTYDIVKCNKLGDTELDKYLGGKQELGEFSSDSGNVSVFDLTEITKYNPDFMEWYNSHKDCATIINNFEGDVFFVKAKNSEEKHIVGAGNFNFFTY